jgi:hypothetical protein
MQVLSVLLHIVDIGTGLETYGMRIESPSGVSMAGFRDSQINGFIHYNNSIQLTYCNRNKRRSMDAI